MKYVTSLYLHVSKSHNAIVIFSVSPESTNVAWSLQNCHFKSIIQETFCCSKAWNPCTNDDNIDGAFYRIWRHCLVHLKSTHEPHSNATVDYVKNRADSFLKHVHLLPFDIHFRLCAVLVFFDVTSCVHRVTGRVDIHSIRVGACFGRLQARRTKGKYFSFEYIKYLQWLQISWGEKSYRRWKMKWNPFHFHALSSWWVINSPNSIH